MCKKITFLLILSLLIISCSEDNSSGPSNENGSGSQGSEIPCNTSNEGMVIKPADSETERICKDGVWEVVLNSSSSVQVVESSSSEIINIPVPVNSSANEIFSSSGEESSSSILSSGETRESSSSETEIIEQSSSSSEEFIESSSSEETKLYLCEDGETYVLDPANCEKVSSSSVIVVSSSSDNKPISSSSDVQESSSSEMSSSSVKIDSSSSTIESSSSNISSSSNTESSSGESSSSSLVFTGACKTATEDNCVYGTLYDDRDGKTYKTVKIGDQEWMAENLNYEVARISNTSIKSTCYIKWIDSENPRVEQPDSCTKYGRYYSWTAAIDSISLYNNESLSCGGSTKPCDNLSNLKVRGVCPEGWHLPSSEEWSKLIYFVGEDESALLLKSSEYWDVSPGIDSFGYTVLPAGYVSNGTSYQIRGEARFWTATDYDKYSAKSVLFNYYSATPDKVSINNTGGRKVAHEAYSVRCIRD